MENVAVTVDDGAQVLEAVRERNPGFMIKTSELISRFSPAAQRYATR